MATIENDTQPAGQRRSPFQFSIRHVLEGMAWLAVLLAIVVHSIKFPGLLLFLVNYWTAALLVSLNARFVISGATAWRLWLLTAFLSGVLLSAV